MKRIFFPYLEFKIKVKTLLILGAIDAKEANNPYFVWPLPSIELDETSLSSFDAALSLLKYISNIDGFNGQKGWVVVKFGGVFDNKKLTKDIHLIYTSIIPETIKLLDKNYQWKKILDIQKEDSGLELEKNILFTTGVKL